MKKKTFIIAEAGVNHNGKLDLAFKLIDSAAKAGADAVKFQTFKAEQVVTQKGEMAVYQKKNVGKVTSQHEMLRKLELREEFYIPLIKHAKKRNIQFLSTPHGGRQSVEFLETLDIPIYKIGSGDLTNYILLSRVAKTKKPIILSTGMATLKEIQHAIQFLKNNLSGPITVLHCTTNYPCSPDEVNFRAMQTMMKELDVPIGYSDHTIGIQAAIMSAALGAVLYECHFTLDKSYEGPDHAASVDSQELKQRIDAIRMVEIMLGNSRKEPTRREEDMVMYVRKSIVASSDLSKGHIIRDKDLEAKRPGDGLSPIYFQNLLGKELRRNIKKDEKIQIKDIKKQ